MAGRAHAELRRIITPFFAPSAVDALVPFLRAEGDRLLDQIVDAPGADLVAGFIEPLVLRAVFDTVGVHAGDRTALTPLVRATMGLLEHTPIAPSAMPSATMLRISLVFDRRRRQGPLVGLHRALWHAVEAGTITKEHATFALSVVLHGGYENPMNLLGLVADRAVAGTREAMATETDLSALGAVRGLVRWARADTPRFGVQAGQAVWLDLDSADPTTGPPRSRGRPPRSQLGFGWGAHRCPGIHLATALSQIVIDGLARVTPETLRGAVASPRTGQVTRGVDSLLLTTH